MIIELNADSIKSELLKIDVHKGSMQIFLEKYKIIPVKLYAIKAPAANIIKQEMLSLGGDCAVNKKCINCTIDYSDVILFGTQRHYKGLVAKLKTMAFFGLVEIAKEIEEFLTNSNIKTILADGRVINYENLKVMGIINETPDSFYENSRNSNVEDTLRTAEKMIKNGAEILDIGGESTRPGSDPVDVQEEIRRVVPSIEAIKREFKDIIISVDTYRAETAKAAIMAGADIINDISAMQFDEHMAEVVRESNVPVILMHIKGEPKNMQVNPTYQNLMDEVFYYFDERINFALDNGINKNKIIIDPGICFGKSVNDNLELMKRVKELKSFKVPVLLAVSRKSTIGKVLGDIDTEERLEGTIATSVMAVEAGVNIVRVHDVKENSRAIRMMEAIKNCI